MSGAAKRTVARQWPVVLENPEIIASQKTMQQMRTAIQTYVSRWGHSKASAVRHPCLSGDWAACAVPDDVQNDEWKRVKKRQGGSIEAARSPDNGQMARAESIQ